MHKRQEIQEKSRLGLLLINKGLITREQLDQALNIQMASDMRLGEVLISQGWITAKQLNRSLKKQTRYRYVAAITAMLLGPIQPFMASASTEQNASQTISQMAEVSAPKRSSGLKPMDDEALGEITAQGRAMDNYNKLLDIVSGSLEAENPEVQNLQTLTELLLPVTGLLDSDVEISGVEYADTPRTQVNADGSLALALPTKIGQLAFRNVRVKGSSQNHFGDLTLNNIDLSNVRVSIRVRN